MQKSEHKKKRYYKLNEKVWLKKQKTIGRIVSLDIPNLQAEVTYLNNENEATRKAIKFMNIDKYRIKKHRSRNKDKPSKVDTLLMAKIRESAILPTKDDENAGYDIYACFDEEELYIPKFKPTIVPTGIAISLLPNYYLNVKHERGSTGLLGMCLLSGVIDSSYRGEIFLNMTPLYKDVVISKKYEKAYEDNDTIYYPYNKAICQGTIDFVPNLKVKEIPYEKLMKIPSKRGTGSLDSTNK